MQSFSITQAGITALVAELIGNVIAFVPSWAGHEQALISVATTLVAAAFLIANAIHAHAAAKQRPSALLRALSASPATSQAPAPTQAPPAAQ